MIHKQNIILTGPPRSGTTLTCHLLNKLNDTVALHEPMNLQMFAPPVQILGMVKNFFDQMRQEITENGHALSKIALGSIPDNPFAEGGGQRKSIVQKGYFAIDKPLSDNFSLYIKHNAHFTFCLSDLVDHFPICVVLRNPISTLASWSSIEAPVAEGRVKVLYHLKPEMAAHLDSIEDVTQRQITLLELHFQQYLKWKDQLIFVRYEDIVNTGGKALSVVNPDANSLQESLESKNKLSRYGKEKLSEWLTMACNPNLSFWQFYDMDEVLAGL